jgi:GGDEF domain-containing protein
VLTERSLRWEGLNVLDPETLLFSRRYLDAIFPIEVERAKRIHQPMALLLIEYTPPQLSTELWREISTRLLTSLRRTDLIVRYEEHIALILLPITEAALTKQRRSRSRSASRPIRSTAKLPRRCLPRQPRH